jgi:hypothetical protein
MKQSFFTVFVYFLMFGSVGISQAAEQCASPGSAIDVSQISALKHDLANVIPCTMLGSMKNPPIGSKCLSSTGFEFIRSDDGWRDAQGLVWADRVKSNTNWFDAEKYCKGRGLRLPTENEIRLADSEGLHDLATSLQKKRLWFWTSTMERKGLAQIYSLDLGRSDIADLGMPFETYSVRCVYR